MSLLVGIAILALAVLLGGLAALWGDPGRKAMPAVRTFAVVAAASIAALHLLPEAISSIGYRALLATAIGMFGPALVERAIPSQHHHTHEAPTTALAIGYAAVIAHQASEGAAIAALSRTGALSMGIVLAIAAHTVPLAMVVAIRVLEVKRGQGSRGGHAIGIALAGIALATVAGALVSTVVGAARIAAVEPWILASVAGLLLHALFHDAGTPAEPSTRARLADVGAGLAGLLLATFGVEHGGWVERIPETVRVAGWMVLAGGIAVRGFWPHRAPHDHTHD